MPVECEDWRHYPVGAYQIQQEETGIARYYAGKYGFCRNHGICLCSHCDTTLSLKPVKMVMDGVLKIDHHRVFPKYSSQTFESWFKKNAMASQDNYKKHVSFFHGCYTNYNFPQLGKDMVSVLNAIGYGVHLLEKEKCCGVALISNGLINQARKQAEANLRSVRKSVFEDKRPVIGASSTCIFTMRDEYPHLLGIDNADVRDSIELGLPGSYSVCSKRET